MHCFKLLNSTYILPHSSYLCICLSLSKDCKVSEAWGLCDILTFVYSAWLILGLLIIEKVLSNTCQMNEGNRVKIQFEEGD